MFHEAQLLVDNLPGKLFYHYTVNLRAEQVSVSELIKPVSLSNVIVCFAHVRGDELSWMKSEIQEITQSDRGVKSIQLTFIISWQRAETNLD